MKEPVNDILEPLQNDQSFLNGHTGGIIDFNNVSVLADNYQLPKASNDVGYTVKLDSTDILDLGNNIVITGHDTDSIHFEDTGWFKLNKNDPLPGGILKQDGFDVYMHESGAIVQIEHAIMINYHDPGSV